MEQRVYKNCGIALAVAFGTCFLAINGFRFEVSDRGIGAYEKMCARCLLGSVTFQTAPIIVRKKLSFGHLKSPTPYVKAAISLNNLVARESCIYPLPSTIYSALVAFLVRVISSTLNRVKTDERT